MQSMHITTNVVSMNPDHKEVYSIQHYVIKFFSRCFSPGTPVSATNKTDLHDITKILLKVALNNITVTLTQYQQNKSNRGLYMTSFNISFEIKLCK